MRKALIEGIVCHHADPLRINGILGAILVCETDGKAATVAALLALKRGGHVVYNSIQDLASEAPAKLRMHHCTRPGTLWEPRIVQPGEVIDGYAEGEECPQHVEGVGEFFAVVRDVAIFHAHHFGARKSVLWGLGDLSAWAAALGDLVLASGVVLADDYVAGPDDEDQPPHVRPTLDLDVMG